MSICGAILIQREFRAMYRPDPSRTKLVLICYFLHSKGQRDFIKNIHAKPRKCTRVSMASPHVHLYISMRLYSSSACVFSFFVMWSMLISSTFRVHSSSKTFLVAVNGTFSPLMSFARNCLDVYLRLREEPSLCPNGIHLLSQTRFQGEPIDAENMCMITAKLTFG